MTDTPDINVEIPEISVENVTEAATNFWEQSIAFVMNETLWIPAIIVIVALGFGFVARGILRPITGYMVGD